MKNRHLLFLITILFVPITYCGAQSSSASEDQRNGIVERDRMINELGQLRDSINLTLADIAVERKTAKSSNQHKLDRATKYLKIQYEKLEVSRAEIISTSQNGWDDASALRLNTSITEVRHEYHRIKNDTKRYAVPSPKPSAKRSQQG